MWVMIALKIPLGMLLYIVWWAVRAVPEPIAGDGRDGGPGDRDPHGPRPGPSPPRRRGPHGATVVPPPPRTRTPATTRDAGRPAQR
jgi:hypothetical protein